jgi:hydroxymethylglutaryl-CoA synthase
MSTAPGPVSVRSIGAAAPALRLPAAQVAAAWGSGGSKGTVALCDSDEDTLTIAWDAATAAMSAAGVSAAEVGGLWWGTTRPPFAEGPSHAFLAASLGLADSSGGALFSGSPHAGMEALFGAWDAIGCGAVSVALVVVSDALVPGLGTAGETTTGAGAAAVVVGPADGGAPARLVGRTTRWLPAVDRYRADGEGATGDVYDPRLFREEVYIPLLSSVGGSLARSGDDGMGAPALWSVSDPDGKLGASLAKRLGAPLASSAVQSVLGDSGAAAPLLGLAQASLADPRPRQVGVIGYGGGRASAVSVELLDGLPGASSISGALGGGIETGYTAAIRARGQLEPMAEPIQMGLPPGGAAFTRGNVEMLLLEGARCRACGTISTPPSVHPACTGCGGKDLEVVKLSRKGSVVTFVVNQTMPPPFAAPLPLVVVELDDGARVMVQGMPADASRLDVGDRVTLSLRRYALERGIPVYGYKATRTPATTAADGAGANRAGAGASRDLEEVRT